MSSGQIIGMREDEIKELIPDLRMGSTAGGELGTLIIWEGPGRQIKATIRLAEGNRK
jgi:hypothetical protein